MKAVHLTKYGSPEVLELIDIPKPEPKDNEILVRAHASSINAYDHHIMQGKPFMVHFREGFFKPHRRKILGCDVAGTVEAVGSKVSLFKVGDAVYGCLADGLGDAAFAQYVCAKAEVFALMPQTISFEQAGSMPMAAVTALQGLRDVGKIAQGQQVLINGASGGIGTFAVQIAKALGAEVTGVCSTRNAELVRSIGADHVIDYTKEDFSTSGRTYDLILDNIANHSLPNCRRVLKPNGICAVVGFSTLSHVLQVVLFGKQTKKRDGKIIEMVMANNTSSEDLRYLNKLLESGAIKPVIDACYPLNKVQDAFTHYEVEHPRGKIVLTMDEAQ